MTLVSLTLCKSGQKVEDGRLTAVFRRSLQVQFAFALCLSFILSSSVVHTDDEKAIGSQAALLNGEGKGTL